MFEPFAHIALIGIGATAVIDGWALMLRYAFDAPAPNFRLVGRWVGHMRHGVFAHERIAAAPAVRGEQAVGWLTHYATGIVFAGVLVAITGPGWLARPTVMPALIFGVATVAAPFLIMQPALGLGFAASKSPNPPNARLRSLTTHLIFGVGMFLSGSLAAAFLG